MPENALEVLVKFLPLTDQGRAACVNKGLRDVIRPLSPDLRYHARAGNVGPLISVLRSREHCVSAKNNALLGLEASTKFDFEVASILLSSGASVDARDENEYNRTPLMLAVRKGCYEVVHRLLAFGADVNAVDELGYTPLLVAAASSKDPVGGGNCIARLVRAGADVNAVGPFGRTPLCLMMGRQHYCNEALAAFLECGADVDAATEDGDTPLMLAVTRGLCCRDVLLPLSRKANLEATNNRGETALFMAIRSRHAEAVGVLLAAGAVVRPEDSLLLKSFPEALSSACLFNKLGVVATLLALGGLANTVIGYDKTYGETVLMWASTRGFVDIVAQLCGQDPDLEAVNRQGKKALHLAACGKREEHLEIVSVLLAAGAVPSGSVSHAVIGGNRQMVELLLAAGADVNAKECIGGHWSTPLCCAARRSAAMTNFILSCGALPNVLDANGMSPLLHAVDHTYEAVGETIEMLIAAGADMEARPVCADRCLASLYGGQTPLMRAVDIGSMVAFRALVAAGANVIAVDAKGWAVTKLIHASSHSVNVRNEMIRGVYRARGWPIPSEQDMHTAQ